MDANANIEELRRLCAEYENGYFNEHDTERLVSLVMDLDEWLLKGGALPASWKQHR